MIEACTAKNFVELKQTFPAADQAGAVTIFDVSGNKVRVISDFERSAFPLPKVSGREMLAYLMELHELKQMNLRDELGGQSVVSDILSGKRDLNLKQVQSLCRRFRVSPSAFLDAE